MKPGEQAKSASKEVPLEGNSQSHPRLKDITTAVADLFIGYSWLTQEEKNTLMWALSLRAISPADEYAVVPRVEAAHNKEAFRMIASYIKSIDAKNKRQSKAARTKKENTDLRNRIIGDEMAKGVLKTPEEFFKYISDNFSHLLRCGKRRISLKSMMDSYTRSIQSRR
jgi:hypothetical protein